MKVLAIILYIPVIVIALLLCATIWLNTLIKFPIAILSGKAHVFENGYAFNAYTKENKRLCRQIIDITPLSNLV